MFVAVSGFEFYEAELDDVRQSSSEGTVKSMCGACAFRDECEYVGSPQDCPQLGGIDVSADQVRLVNYCGRCKQCSVGAVKDVASGKDFGNNTRFDMQGRPIPVLRVKRFGGGKAIYYDRLSDEGEYLHSELRTIAPSNKIRAPVHQDSSKLPCFFSGKCRLHDGEVEHVDHLRLAEFRPFDPKPATDSEFTNNIAAEPSPEGGWTKIQLFSGAT